MRPRLPKLTLDALLCNLLLYLLLVCYIVIVYATVLLTLTLLGLATSLSADGLVMGVWWGNLLVVILCAITFLPVRRWLQSNINTVIYGEHDDPYLLIAGINHHLQTMTTPQLSLPIIAESIARDLKLPYVAITGELGDVPLHIEVGSKTARTAINVLPIRYLEKPLGELVVSARSIHDSLSDEDLQLLGDVAQQIGIALHTLQLTADLQSSRERIIVSREEERRRIRNDLHDGLGPTLSSLQLQLGAMRNLIRHNPDEAEAAVDEMRRDLRQATAEIRQLVYALRPPLLDELGLVEAIKSIRVQGGEMRLEVNAPEEMPKLSAALEVAVYRIASEAIHNVIKHAQASACVVCLEVTPATLKIIITDNGKGLPDAPDAGVGFNSMRERAAELGGTLHISPNANAGVEVIAHFPLVG